MVVDRFNQNATHAAVDAGNGDFQCAHGASLLRLGFGGRNDVLSGLNRFDGFLNGITFGACEDIVFKVQGQVALFFDDAVAAGVESVIPAVGMEGVAQEWRTEQQLDLVAGHTLAQGNHGARIELVTLNDFKFVGWKVGYALGTA